ncbi:Vacuolar protein sorting-associated protein ist1 [Lodderomyces elongisporus]|uniref:Vacuolar protein sorting-associated protein ist1 n=1 Tax=Lodderomyces elongisporus TaxID=36914 RepID=UPI00292023CF|nr:Vacuolar protein sorting-associated protein ist1 [Lodderomyces elongisporus]WLF78540.1 Vacuolar protein sorting-associated protein ist1 [Lodderomyces elongisporus]
MSKNQINPTRLKTSLKMCLSKLQYTQEKQTAMAKQQRRNISHLLSQGKESSAKIKVENIIRDDIYIELMEYLELYVELLLARLGMIINNTATNIPTTTSSNLSDESKNDKQFNNATVCDPSLLEPIQSIIYSAPHTDLKELVTLRDILVSRYGVEFTREAMENGKGYISEKIIRRCGYDPPSEELVDLYLCEIAKTYGVPYSGLRLRLEDEVEEVVENEGEQGDHNNDDANNNNNNGGGGVGEKNKENPIAEKVDEMKKKVANNGGIKEKDEKPQDDFDALRARFAALKGTPK